MGCVTFAVKFGSGVYTEENIRFIEWTGTDDIKFVSFFHHTMQRIRRYIFKKKKTRTLELLPKFHTPPRINNFNGRIRTLHMYTMVIFKNTQTPLSHAGRSAITHGDYYYMYTAMVLNENLHRDSCSNTEQNS